MVATLRQSQQRLSHNLNMSQGRKQAKISQLWIGFEPQSLSLPLSIALSHPFAYCDCLAFDSPASLLRNYRVLSRCRIRCKRQFNHMFCQQHVARSLCCKVPLCPLMGQLATNGNGCNTTPTSLCPRHSFQGSFWPRLLLCLCCVCSSHAFEPCDFWHCHKVIIVKIFRSWEMLIFQL